MQCEQTRSPPGRGWDATLKSHPQVEGEDSKGCKELQVHLQWTQLDTNTCSLSALEAAAEALELRECLRVELVAQVAARAVDVLGLDELGEEAA